MNAQRVFTIAIATPLVTTQKAHTLVPVNQVFVEMVKPAMVSTYK